MVIDEQIFLFGQDTDYFFKMDNLALLGMFNADEHVIDTNFHGAFLFGVGLIISGGKLGVFTKNT